MTKRKSEDEKIKEALMIHNGRKFAKIAMMLARMKEWCKQNPGKKALLSSSSELSQTLTYDVGNKVFIYSTVKVPLEPTTVDQTWVRQRFFDDNRIDFTDRYMGNWNAPYIDLPTNKKKQQ